MWTGNGAAIDCRHNGVDETRGSSSHVQDRRDAVGQIDGQVVPSVRMRVHVGQARRQIRCLVPIDDLRVRGYRQSTAHRLDLVAFDDDGLIREHSFTVHRNDVDMHERRGSCWCRAIACVHGKRPKDRPERCPEVQVAHCATADRSTGVS